MQLKQQGENMSIDGKPETPEAATAPAGTETPQQPETPANPAVEVSDSVRSYLKGLGLEGVNATPELVKVAEAGMKQKESVSRSSLEIEQLKAKLASQGADLTPPKEETKTEEPAPQETQSTQPIGVTDNELFDLSRMIATDFKEIAAEAEDGSLFRDLRERGYFTAKGIDKKAVYAYLQAKNDAAKELRELREFKEQYSRPNPSDNPAYNQTPGLNMNGEMNQQIAERIVSSGDTQNQRYAEALAFLRKGAMDRKSLWT